MKLTLEFDPSDINDILELLLSAELTHARRMDRYVHCLLKNDLKTTVCGRVSLGLRTCKDDITETTCPDCIAGVNKMDGGRTFSQQQR